MVGFLNPHGTPPTFDGTFTDFASVEEAFDDEGFGNRDWAPIEEFEDSSGKILGVVIEDWQTAVGADIIYNDRFTAMAKRHGVYSDYDDGNGYWNDGYDYYAVADDPTSLLEGVDYMPDEDDDEDLILVDRLKHRDDQPKHIGSGRTRAKYASCGMAHNHEVISRMFSFRGPHFTHDSHGVHGRKRRAIQRMTLRTMEPEPRLPSNLELLEAFNPLWGGDPDNVNNPDYEYLLN